VVVALTSGPAEDTHIYTHNVAVVAGAPYKVTFWVYGDGSNESRHGLYDATNISWINAIASTGHSAASWTQVVYYFVAPPGCVNVSLYLMCPDLDTAFAYFDDASIMDQQSAGLTTIDDPWYFNAPGFQNITDSPSGDFQYEGQIWFQNVSDATVVFNIRASDATHYIECKIDSHQGAGATNGRCGIKDRDGAVWAGNFSETGDFAVAAYELIRFKLVCLGPLIQWYVDDKLIVEVTDATFNQTETGDTNRLIANTYERYVVCNELPISPRGMTIARSQANPQWDDPRFGLMADDGTSFAIDAGWATFFDFKSFTTDSQVLWSFNTSTASSAWPRGYLSNQEIKIQADDATWPKSADHTAGDYEAYLLTKRSFTFGVHLFQHQAGNEWKRLGLGYSSGVANDTAYAIVDGLHMAIHVRGLALLDLSSMISGDFLTVTDTETNPAGGGSGVSVECDADFHINFTLTYETTKNVYITARRTDADNNVFLHLDDDEDLILYNKTDASNETLGTVNNIFTDGVAVEIDWIAEGGVSRIYVDKVLQISTSGLSWTTVTDGNVWHDLASNDLVVTIYPYPALGGREFGATDRVICPANNDTASCETDHIMVMRDVIVPSTAATHFHRGTVYDALPYCLGTVIGNAGELELKEYRSGGADTRISAGAATVTDNDHITVEVDGLDSEQLVGGVSSGTYASTKYFGNTGFKVFSMGTGGVMDWIEFWPLYIYPPLWLPE
jgi:hypothetical protein